MAPPFRAALLLASIASGIAAGFLLLPVLFRLIPNDLARIATVVDAMEHAPPPAVVIFGDSRGESAVDAAQLSRSLPGKPLAYNFCWHGQRLDHSFVLYDRLPHSVRTVINLVSLQDFSQETPGDLRIYRAMRAYGFNPDAEAMATLETGFGRPSIASLYDSEARIRWESRWGVRHLFDTGLRYFVRHDLMLERERRDLFFPTAYTRRIESAAMALAIENYAHALPAPSVSHSKTILMEKLGAWAKQRSCRLVLVIPAVHSRGVVDDHDRRVADVTALGRSVGIEVVDLSHVLPDDDFVDLEHTTSEGARKFTMALAQYCGHS